MPRVFDNQGNELGAMGTFGADIWEIFHPGQVQAEQAATGQPILPDFINQSNAIADIPGAFGTQISDTATSIGDAVQTAVSKAFDLVPLIVVGIIVVAVTSHMPREKR